LWVKKSTGRGINPTLCMFNVASGAVNIFLC
jgi:hypothetical protein